MNLADIMLNEISQSQKDDYLVVPLTGRKWGGQIIESGSRMEVARGWGRGHAESPFNVGLERRKILEMEGGEG